MKNNQLLKKIPDLINKTFPIPARFRSKLPHDVKELSKLLTSNRGERALSYMNRPNLLSAYLHYFLPWNIIRLCLLLESIDIKLNNNDVIIDLGSGTLTFIIALWIARPDLQKKSLKFYCVDRSGQALEAGKKLFLALNDKSSWKINLIKKEIKINELIHIKEKEKIKLISCINLFNEIYEDIPHKKNNEFIEHAKKISIFLKNQGNDNSYFLIVEPGVPQSGKFISLLRESFIKIGLSPLAPCTHYDNCPLADTQVKKWCHFGYEDFNAPKELISLSKAAGLPKEKLNYSYLFVNHRGHKEHRENTIRIISGAFSLPNNLSGRYGCSEKGLVLIKGDKDNIDRLVSGCVISDYKLTDEIDAKSEALIVKIKRE